MRPLLLLMLLCLTLHAWAEGDSSPSVQLFSPQGAVKGIRQASARFSTAMVPLGDPRLQDPFEVQCDAGSGVPAPTGKGRWADPRHWVYDFDHDLPAGIRCRFQLRAALKDVAGAALPEKAHFEFSTGGPAVLESLPGEGQWNIDEQQIFILGLDAPVQRDTVREHVWCSAEGLHERIGVRLLEGEARRQVLQQNLRFFDQYWVMVKSNAGLLASFITRLPRAGTRSDAFLKLADAPDAPIVVLQCQRPLPNSSKVQLVWGKGIQSASGMASATDQRLMFQTREPFRARFTCTRNGKNAPCLPITPLDLRFSAPISKADADGIRLTDAQGKRYPGKAEPGAGNSVEGISFAPPFAEKTQLTLKLPANLQDDAGRTLVNRARFPLNIKIGEDPPLAKFAARFGIVELNGDAALPVTLRNVESTLTARQLQLPEIAGRSLDVAPTPQAITAWLRQLSSTEYDQWEYNPRGRHPILTARAGERPLLELNAEAKSFKLPKPNGAKAFEVIGIPLKQPGFHLVELASPRLGAALLNKPQPYYVQAAALVTNLAVHFKHGRESSLVWVTTLDRGLPAANVEVQVGDCAGELYWKGKTDPAGIARIPQPLPQAPGCLDQHDRQYFVSATLGKDYSFLLSRWNEGIDTWRFNLPRGAADEAIALVSVADRTLLRAGETVHFKHYARQREGKGFGSIDASRLGKQLTLRHIGGSEEEVYQIPLQWDASGIAESTWSVPKEAKQGEYALELSETLSADGESRAHQSARVRVEAFRIPLMKAMLQGPAQALVGVRQAPLTLQVNYLSGGGAAYAKTELRAVVEPYQPHFADWDGYTFANGDVKEGQAKEEEQPWRIGEYSLEGGEEAPSEPATNGAKPLAGKTLTLDAAGGARATLDDLPLADTPQVIEAELEYRDPNGEFMASSTRLKWWPSAIVLGIKQDSWVASRDHVRFLVAALDPEGKPRRGVKVTVDFFQKAYFSHRKRLIGGFYSYESHSEVKRLGAACAGVTDDKGLLPCDVKPPGDGNLILRAHAADAQGRISAANLDTWVPGQDDGWFTQSNDNRMDVLPEKKRYAPTDTAKLQVRMPFRQASALVTVEREGVLDAFVQPLNSKSPIVSLPLKGSYAPNVFVSVLAVRGRADDVQPTALVDLGKPAFRLGYAELKVGWQAHELKVSVKPEQTVYPVRGLVKAVVEIKRADGGKLPPDTEFALAAVDEGLLELMPNESWKLLDSMMAQRGIEVDNSSAQMQVIGKRHYGRKTAPPGGGGGHASSRELFDPLLLWSARIRVDSAGRARIKVPLNDALTSFRLVAVANAAIGLFGTGEASVRTHQDLMLFSGLPPLVRELDAFRGGFTVRNASDHGMTVRLSGTVKQAAHGQPPTLLYPKGLQEQTLRLAPGEARLIGWNARAPVDARQLFWQVDALERQWFGLVDGTRDSLKARQEILPAVPTRVFQATISQLDQPLTLPVRLPVDAMPGRGGIEVSLKPALAGNLSGVVDYMKQYPFDCLEQNLSRAIALRDRAAWEGQMQRLPAYLDRDGLLKYFPQLEVGDDTLTAYALAIAAESGWELPPSAKAEMLTALTRFVEGKLQRNSALATADLAIRKMAAIDALSRHGAFQPTLLQSFDIAPDLWPTSAVLDWADLLQREAGISEREAKLAQAMAILRARLNFQGASMRFSTERQDALWWLMVSADSNANRMLLSALRDPAWAEDIPRLVRGSLGRMQRGHWNTTVANAWGVLAMEKFGNVYEATPVTGSVVSRLGQAQQKLDWAATPQGGSQTFAWPPAQTTLQSTQQGSGKPWATVTARAAIPLKQALSSGFRIQRSVTPIKQAVTGKWRAGDVARVRLDLEAQSDMTWVAVNDPIPAGAALLGGGLGRDAKLLTQGEKKVGWVWPAFEERRQDSFRAFYRYVPKGQWTLEYTVRYNNAGRFVLPETRVEAMYAPEMFGELPNAALEISP